MGVKDGYTSVGVKDGYNSVGVKDGYNSVVQLQMPTIDSTLGQKLSSSCASLVSQFQAELATKWVCNALTTGAHILKGKVCLNFMVDVLVRLESNL